MESNPRRRAVALGQSLPSDVTNQCLKHKQWRQLMSNAIKFVDCRCETPHIPGSETKEEQIIGARGGLKEVIKKTEVVGPTPSSVLLLGETGTGKSLIAKSIHDASERRNHAFIQVNCAAIPLGLLHCKLFFPYRGPFTEAQAQPTVTFEPP